jgi:hypothetical protein
MMDDPLIDEVRAIRRKVVEAAGHDLDTLFSQLREVEADYAARKGIFAAIPRALDEELFPDMNKPLPDPLIDEIRAIRAHIAKERGLT